MNTKLLMTASAIIMIAAGVILTFAADDIQAHFSPADQSGIVRIILQLMGALYFGFGMINWTAKANLIGGIYSRPVAIGNFSHFMIGGLALIKGYISSGDHVLFPAMIVYAIFAIAFGVVFFTHPVAQKN